MTFLFCLLNCQIRAFRYFGPSRLGDIGSQPCLSRDGPDFGDHLLHTRRCLDVGASGLNRLRKKVPAPPRHGVGERLIRGHCSQRTNVSHSGASRFPFARPPSEENRLAFSAPC